jgi:hypothetical protein
MLFLTRFRLISRILPIAALIGLASPFLRAQSDDRKAELEAKRAAEKEATEAARTQIAEFNKAVSGRKKPADIAQAIRTLTRKHSLILERLIHLLSGPGDATIHGAVVDMLVAQDDPRCIPALNDTLRKRLLKSRDNAAICIALLKGIAHYGDRRSAPCVVAALDNNDNAIAKAGCSVAGRIKDPMVVDELIKLLRQAEQRDTYIGGGNNAGGGFNRGMRAVNRRKELREPAQKALREVTGKTFGSARAWKEWWSKNRARWKPDAAK